MMPAPILLYSSSLLLLSYIGTILRRTRPLSLIFSDFIFSSSICIPRSMLFWRSRFRKLLIDCLALAVVAISSHSGLGRALSAVMISIWSPLLICVVIGSSLWLILALMALLPIFEWMSYAKSSAVAPNGIFRASPFGVNTTISEVYSDNLKLSKKSTAFSVGLFSAARICFSHLSNSSSSCEIVACLYFQWAANPLSAISSIR